jgi:hypothetical protein
VTSAEEAFSSSALIIDVVRRVSMRSQGKSNSDVDAAWHS